MLALKDADAEDWYGATQAYIGGNASDPALADARAAHVTTLPGASDVAGSSPVDQYSLSTYALQGK